MAVLNPRDEGQCWAETALDTFGRPRLCIYQHTS